MQGCLKHCVYLGGSATAPLAFSSLFGGERTSDVPVLNREGIRHLSLVSGTFWSCVSRSKTSTMRLVWCGGGVLSQERVGLDEVSLGSCSSTASQEDQGAPPGSKSNPSNAKPMVQVMASAGAGYPRGCGSARSGFLQVLRTFPWEQILTCLTEWRGKIGVCEGRGGTGRAW